MIEVSHVTKRYARKIAVDDISFSVTAGEIVGFLGPNGAGKSTTMNILAGYISATEGTAKINDIDILENPIDAKKLIGYLPERPPLYFDMIAEEQLDFACELKGIKNEKEKKAEIDRLCDLVRINDVRGRMIKNLSKGYKQRVGLVQALIGNPDVLILDEPMVGLDPKQNFDIRNVLKQLRKDHTIIFSSHILSEIQNTCDRVLVMDEGVIIADDTPERLSGAVMGNTKLTARILGPETEVFEIIRGLRGVINCDATKSSEANCYDYLIEAEINADIRQPLFYELARKSYPLVMLKPQDVSLEEIFLRLTGDTNERRDGE